MDVKLFIKKEYNNWEEKNYVDKCVGWVFFIFKVVFV